MIVDTSALIAVVRDEPDASVYAGVLAAAGASLISAANYVEAAIVVDASRDPVAVRRFDQLVQVAELSVTPVTVEQARIAREAYRASARGAGIPPVSTSATALPTRLPRITAMRCCSRVPTSPTRTSPRRCPEARGRWRERGGQRASTSDALPWWAGAGSNRRPSAFQADARTD